MKRIKLLTALCFLVNITSTHAQIITTVAGIGTVSGYSGNGGQATSAKLNSPAAITFDAAGNLYIADAAQSNTVRKVSTTGVITTIAGNGGVGYTGNGGQAVAAQLTYPSGVAVDAAGNIYIADTGNNWIRKINTIGVITLFAGSGLGGFSGNQGFNGDGGPATSAQLNYPMGIALDAAGNLYIADYNNNRIRMVNTAGIISTVVGSGGTYAASLSEPAAVAFDAAGNMYISDSHNQVVRKVNTLSGVVTILAGTGTSGYTGDGGQATAAQLANPYGLAVDASGNVFISERNNNLIRKVNTAGILTTVAGTTTNLPQNNGFSGDGGLATLAQLNNPYALAFDAAGNLYIADTQNSAVRKVSAALTLAVNSANICAGTTTTLTASGATNYTWSPATGLSAATGSMVVANPTVTTTYTITGTTGSSMGTATATVIVNPSSSLMLFTNNATICAGSTTNLMASGASTYTWTNGITNGVPFTPSGSAIYTVTATDANNCISTATISVTVNNLPSVTASATNTMVCSGSQTTLTGGGAATYTWTDGLGVGLINGVPFTPTGSITYTVTGTDANNCINTATISVIVNNLPPVTASATNTMVCSGNQTTLTGSGAATYTWTNGVTNGVAFTPTITTTYTVTGTDINNCPNTSTLSVIVMNCTVGIKQITSNTNEVLVYPNPNSGNFMITTTENAKTIIVSDMLGNELLLINPISTTTTVNLSRQPNGIYFIKVIADNAQVVKRIIINR